MIPQHYPLYIQEAGGTAGQGKVWLIIGWLPDDHKPNALPGQPVVLLCGATTEAPFALPAGTDFTVLSTGRDRP